MSGKLTVVKTLESFRICKTCRTRKLPPRVIFNGLLQYPLAFQPKNTNAHRPMVLDISEILFSKIGALTLISRPCMLSCDTKFSQQKAATKASRAAGAERSRRLKFVEWRTAHQQPFLDPLNWEVLHTHYCNRCFFNRAKALATVEGP